MYPGGLAATALSVILPEFEVAGGCEQDDFAINFKGQNLPECLHMEGPFIAVQLGMRQEIFWAHVMMGSTS